MESSNDLKTVYRAIYSKELKNYLNATELKKDSYSLQNCINSYQGKNNLDYNKLAQKFCINEDAYFLHFFDDFKSAQRYEKALKSVSIINEDTTIIACQFPKSLLTSCQGFGIYESDKKTDSKGEFFKEYAIPLSMYSPEENLLGEAKTQLEIEKIEPTAPDSLPQVFYDPDDYSSFF